MEGLITKNINKSLENANKNFPMKRKYTMEQCDNCDEEGAIESKQKPSQLNNDLNNGMRQNIRETENIQKSMVKKKRGRQCLPMA